MTPLQVSFTGLTIDPTELDDRIHYGVVHDGWHRYRFESDAAIAQVNRWLSEHIEGRWNIYSAKLNNQTRYICIAFEQSYDASMFILGDGKKQCLEIKL